MQDLRERPYRPLKSKASKRAKGTLKDLFRGFYRTFKGFPKGFEGVSGREQSLSACLESALNQKSPTEFELRLGGQRLRCRDSDLGAEATEARSS